MRGKEKEIGRRSEQVSGKKGERETEREGRKGWSTDREI